MTGLVAPGDAPLVAGAQPLPGRSRLVLHGDDLVLVADGALDVFAREAASGALHPLGRVGAGGAAFPVVGDGRNGGARDVELLGIAVPGTRVATGSVNAVLDEPALVGGEPALAGLLAGWLALVAGDGAPEWSPSGDEDGEADPVELAAGHELEPASHARWLLVEAGRVRTGARETAPGGLVLLLPGQAATAVGDAVVRELDGTRAVRSPDARGAVAAALAAQLDTVGQRLERARADEETRRSERDRRLDDRLSTTLGVLTRTLDLRDEGPAPDGDDPLVAAVRIVGRHLGFDVRRPGRLTGDLNERLGQVALASGLRTRAVALPVGWEHATRMPLIGQIAEGTVRHPVALVPDRRGRVHLYDPRHAEPRPVTPEVSLQVHPIAQQLYRPLPDEPVGGRRLLRFGLRGARGDLAMLLATGAAVGLLGLLVPILTKVVFSSIIPRNEARELWVVGGALLLAALVAMAFSIVQSLAVVRLSGRLDLAVQSGLWDRLIRLPVPFFRTYAAGDLATRALGIDRIRQLLATVVASASLTLVFSSFNLVLLFTYDVELALLACGLAGLAAMVALSIGIFQAKHIRALTEVDNRNQGQLVQAIQGISKLRVAAAGDRVFTRLAAVALRRQQLAMRQERLGAGLNSFNAGFVALTSAALLAAATRTSWGAVDAATFLAFNAAFAAVVASLLGLSNQLVTLAPAGPLYEALTPILRATPEVSAGGEDPGRLRGAIDVRGASFRYGEDAPLVLDEVSLSVTPGEFVAIVGSSGSGKSTLLRLLLGFEQPTSGHVFYDGKDLARLDVTAVRRQTGVVLQSSRLMPGSLYDNIAGASQAPMSDAWEAARMAGVEEDIRAMPMGLQTMVTGAGSVLSGGQAQRLMIARALVTRPRILLFDEATSSLDNRSQQVVSESIERLAVTRIVIAHRVSTIRHADRILVLDRGRLVESGSYEELMAGDGVFAQLARRQLA